MSPADIPFSMISKRVRVRTRRVPQSKWMLIPDKTSTVKDLTHSFVNRLSLTPERDYNLCLDGNPIVPSESVDVIRDGDSLELQSSVQGDTASDQNFPMKEETMVVAAATPGEQEETPSEVDKSIPAAVEPISALPKPIITETEVQSSNSQSELTKTTAIQDKALAEHVTKNMIVEDTPIDPKSPELKRESGQNPIPISTADIPAATIVTAPPAADTSTAVVHMAPLYCAPPLVSTRKGSRGGKKRLGLQKRMGHREPCSSKFEGGSKPVGLGLQGPPFRSQLAPPRKARKLPPIRRADYGRQYSGEMYNDTAPPHNEPRRKLQWEAMDRHSPRHVQMREDALGYPSNDHRSWSRDQGGYGRESKYISDTRDSDCLPREAYEREMGAQGSHALARHSDFKNAVPVRDEAPPAFSLPANPNSTNIDRCTGAPPRKAEEAKAYGKGQSPGDKKEEVMQNLRQVDNKGHANRAGCSNSTHIPIPSSHLSDRRRESEHSRGQGRDLPHSSPPRWEQGQQDATDRRGNENGAANRIAEKPSHRDGRSGARVHWAPEPSVVPHPHCQDDRGFTPELGIKRKWQIPNFKTLHAKRRQTHKNRYFSEPQVDESHFVGFDQDRHRDYESQREGMHTRNPRGHSRYPERMEYDSRNS